MESNNIQREEMSFKGERSLHVNPEGPVQMWWGMQAPHLGIQSQVQTQEPGVDTGTVM